MKLLLAEDDRETAEFVANGLEELGHLVHLAQTGPDALHIGLTEPLDLLVIDRMLPDLDGIDVLRRLRAAGVKSPVLLLTALGRIDDRVDGLEAGADDYLVKPFAFSELVARLNALGRRPALSDQPTMLGCGTLSMDLLKREVRRNGRVIVLQPREFQLLEALLRGEERLVTRTMLLESVWGYHFDPQTNVVDTHISRLRAKLRGPGEPDLIETIRGSGYRMRCLA